MVCDFERENHRSDIFVWHFFVYVCDRVWICDFGPKNHKWKFVVLILGLAGHEGTGPAEARWGGFGLKKKNPFNKWAGFGFLGQTCESGPDMEKPGPNPTRCHS